MSNVFCIVVTDWAEEKVRKEKHVNWRNWARLNNWVKGNNRMFRVKNSWIEVLIGKCLIVDRD